MLNIIFGIWIIFIIFSSYISRIRFGFIANHYFLTNVYWAICLFISIYHNYYIRPVSDIIYYIFFIGNFFFNVTLFTSKIKKIPNTFPKYTFSLKRRRVLEILVLCIIFPLAYTNLRTIMSGEELWRMYNDYWESRENSGYLWEFFKQNVIEPISFVLMATCLYANYNSLRKYSKSLTLLIGALIALLNMLMTAGGRTGLMQFMFFLFLSFMARGVIIQSDILYKLQKRYIFLILVFGIGVFSFATLGRGGEDVIVIDVILERLSLFPALFEGYYLHTNILDGYYCGLSMFEQPISFLLYPLRLVGLDINFERISTIVSEPRWTPATESLHNAAVSAYTFYMRDFGLLGIAVGPFIVGKIYNFLWNMCRTDSFLIVFYFSGICVTCLDSTYPFARGYFFAILFAFGIRKFLKVGN